MRAIFPEEDLPPGSRIHVHHLDGSIDINTMVIFSIPAKTGQCCCRTYVCDFEYNHLSCWAQWIQDAAHMIGLRPDNTIITCSCFDDIILLEGDEEPPVGWSDDSYLRVWMASGNNPPFDLGINFKGRM